MTKKAVVFLLAIFLAAVPIHAGKKTPWSGNLRPGDKVCIYDIHKNDLMVGDDSYSLKAWYRSPIGNQRSTRQLRPSIKRILFTLLWPGLKLTETDENGAWYSARLVAVKRGYKSRKNEPKLIKRGNNTLVVEKGYSYISNWQTVEFSKVRLKKKPAFGGCERKYKTY